jgi:hypothetical protein
MLTYLVILPSRLEVLRWSLRRLGRSPEEYKPRIIYSDLIALFIEMVKEQKGSDMMRSGIKWATQRTYI